jgi:hypothetical protein
MGLRIGFAASLALVLAPLAVAHHSHGNYELHEYTHLSGTVKELLWINPHSWIHLEVTDDGGNTVDWALEGGGINALTRRGWQSDDIKPGDRISVRCHRLRDGARGCLLGYVTPEGGEEKEWD